MDQISSKINDIRNLLAEAKIELRQRRTFVAFRKFEKIEGLLEALEEEHAAKVQAVKKEGDPVGQET